ncbi:MAG TPA: protein kinase [Gemmatimonadaceae bacterium]|nr:protein kinase [Gemmatimonadaceae bacterium]
MLSRLAAAVAERYRIERELGQGGMATVYLAHDLKHDRKVAVKVLRPELAASLGADRFLREIQITAQLQHPNILTLIDSGLIADAVGASASLYYVMPYVEGETLRQRLALVGELPVADAVRILGDVADALDYAHARGVVHRDVKPENVMLSGRHAMVMDFGVAKAVNEATGRHAQTSAGIALGTPSYMAPEQAAGDQVDHRADIYALGVIAYEILAGRPPFAGDSAQQLIMAHITAAPDPVSKHRPGVPPALAELVRRCLEKKPADRPQSAREVVDTLESVATPGGGVASAPRATRMPRLRSRWTMIAAATGVVAVLLGGWWALRRDSAAGPSAGPSRLAVLPFESRGPAQQSYFIDGVVDEVRGQLTGLRDLRVIARTSSETYRNTRATPQQIGRELRVQYVLTGTVQWQEGIGATKVRVSPELIRTSDGTTAWTRAFDAELSDAFQVQSQVAASVAQALNLALASGDGSGPKKPTSSAAAYTLYLQGEDLFKRAQATDDNGRAAAELLERATALDPSFALAFAKLSMAHSRTYWSGGDRTPARLALATKAAERALALAPELPEAHLAMGYVRYWGHRDYAGALEEYGIAVRARPNDVSILLPFGPVARRQGRWDDAIAALQQVVDLDPRNFSALDDLGGTLSRVGRHREAAVITDSVVSLSPSLVVGWRTAVIVRIAAGDLAAARRTLQRADSTLAKQFPGWFFDKPYAGFERSFAALLDPAVQRRLEPLPIPAAFSADASSFYTVKVALALALGDRAGAGRYAESAWSILGRQVAANPSEPLWQAQLGLAQLQRGKFAEAISAAQRAVQLLPPSRDQVDGPLFEGVLAQVHAGAGNADSALAHLESLARIPSFWSGAAMRSAPAFATLRSDPRFQRLAGPAGVPKSR